MIKDHLTRLVPSINEVLELKNTREECERVEEELHASQKFSQYLIESSLDMIIAADNKRRITQFNNAAEETFGYSRDEVMGKHVNLLYANPREGLKVHEQTVLNGKHVQEIMNKRKNGEIFPTLLSASVLKDNDGNQVGVMGVSRDITKRKRAEDALSESEEKYRKLVTEINYGIFVSDKGTFTFVNQALAHIFGLKKPEDVLGKNLLDFIVPEMKAEIVGQMQKGHETGKTPGQFEVEIIKADGSRGFIEINPTPIIKDGKIIGAKGIVRDITERKQAEQALRKSEKKYRRLVESLEHDYIIYSHDTQGIFTYLSPSIVNVLGYTQDEFMGHYTQYMTDSPINKDVERYTDAGLRGEKQLPYEAEFWHKDGSRRLLEVTEVLVFDNQGNVLGIEGIVHDITDRKKKEEELRESAAYLDIMGDALMVLDSKARMVKVNKSFSELWGYNPDEVIGKPVFGMFPEEELPKHQTEMENAAREGNTRTFETIALTKDKKEINVSVSGRVLKDEKGKVLNFIALFHDITERKQAEQALHESEEKFRTLFKESRDPIYITSAEGAFIDNNEAWCDLFGYKKEDFKQIKAEDLFNKPADRKQFQTEIAKTDYVKDLEVRYRKKDGAEMICLETATVLRDDKNNIIGYQGIIRDMTEKIKVHKQLEKALFEAQNANKVKDLFLANMSHEIRTPLNSILGFSEIIEESFKDRMDKNEAEYLQIVHHSGQRLIRSVHEILDISQIEAGTIPYNPKIIKLALSVESIFIEFKPTAEVKNLKFTYDCTIDDGAVKVDQPSIEKTITNLVDNAIKYTEEGQIKIQLNEQSGKYVLSISDTGIGMSADYIKHLYDSFSQESTGYTRKYQGLGLGLSIAKRYLDMNNIPIDVESEQGVGTTFSLKFTPLDAVIQEPEIKTRPADTMAEKTASKERPVILLVEDDLFNREALKIILKKQYKTPAAVSVGEAKKQLREHEVDLILLDLSLEGDENGLDLVAYLKAEDKLKDIPIIAVTAHAFTTDRDNVIEAGCDNYMSKPINTKKLLEIIGRYLN